MGVSSLQQTQDLSYPLQDQSIFSPDTSVNQSLHTILPISDDTPKKVRYETLKANDAPINYRSKFQNSLVGVGVLLAIAITAIDMYVQETWVSGIISVICAVVMITAFWMHLFEDNTFSQNESRKMHRMITFLLYSAFLLSLAASILAMVNIVKVYKAGDSTVTEQSSINSISDSSNSTDSTSDGNLEYSIHNRTHGVLESNYDSFGAFLNANPVLIAMIVVESVQFLLYCVLIWNTWSFGKVLDRMQELMDALNKNKSNVKEVELKTFSQASDLVVTY